MSFCKWEKSDGNKYEIAKSGIPTKDLDFITKYLLWREEVEEWQGDEQTPGMYAGYNDNLMQYLHYIMHPIMERETGLSLLPTYTYFRVYRNGSILEKHTDRPACEVSASMLIATNIKESWTLFAEGTHVNQEVGDIFIYRGCDLEHWREPLIANNGEYHVQVFAHYVDANGPYYMCAGDEPVNS